MIETDDLLATELATPREEAVENAVSFSSRKRRATIMIDVRIEKAASLHNNVGSGSNNTT